MSTTGTSKKTGTAKKTQPEQNVETTATSTAVTAGAIGGLVGGVVFGMMMQMMQMMGMIPMVAMLVGSESVAVGWGVHLAISLIFGVAFGFAVQQIAGRWAPTLAAGLGYGVFLWVIGPLLLMPAKLGMPILQFNDVVWQSLMGHMIFGLVLAACTVAVVRSRD